MDSAPKAKTGTEGRKTSVISESSRPGGALRLPVDAPKTGSLC